MPQMWRKPAKSGLAGIAIVGVVAFASWFTGLAMFALAALYGYWRTKRN